MAIVQDSCQSWKVVAACFVIYFTNYGISRITGLLFTESLNYYHADRESTSFPFLLGSVARGVAAPLGGYLSYKFGYQFVIMLGGILSSIGIGTCFFASNIRIVAAHWCIYGLGCGLATCLLPQIINVSFTKHATKANGIALSGASVAGMIYPLITVQFLDKYNIPGTYLNLGGILLHSIVGALLLKKPGSASSTSTNRKNFETSDKFPSAQEITKTMHTVSKENFTVSSKCKYDDSGSYNENKQNIQSLHEVPNRKVCLSKMHPNVENSSYSTSSKHLALYEDTLDEKCGESNAEEIILFRKETKHLEIKVKILHSDENTPEHSKTIFNSVKARNNMQNEDNSASNTKADTAFNGDGIVLNKLRTHSNTYVADYQEKKKPINCRQICSIFWDPVYLIIAFSHSFVLSLFVVVPAILVDLANDKGVAVHLWPHLLVAYSISDLVGKVGFGWVIDGNYMHKCRYIALWFLILAFAFGMMVWSTGFLQLTIAVVLIAMTIGTTSPTFARVVAQFIKKDKHSMAMASSNIFFIPLSLSMSPLIGYFRDQLGSYNGLLYIYCAASILCSALLLVLPHIYNWKEKAKKLISDVED